MNIKNKTFTFFSDPGHGWLRVSQAACNAIGLSAFDFTRYSYQDKTGVQFFLEEDCDAGRFIEKFKAIYGQNPKIDEHYCERTRIRNMRRLPGGLFPS